MGRKAVWVIEQGCYSDYRVVGVFTSRKNAQTVVDLLKASKFGDTPTIARWPLDPAVEELRAGLSPWHVLMLRDGTVERMGQHDVSGSALGGSVSIWRRSKASAFPPGARLQDCLNATVWAKDKKHAIKIVNEKRAQIIAAGKWK